MKKGRNMITLKQRKHLLLRGKVKVANKGISQISLPYLKHKQQKEVVLFMGSQNEKRCRKF